LFFWVYILSKSLWQFKQDGDIQLFVILLILASFVFIENISDSFLTSNKGFFMMMFLGLLFGKRERLVPVPVGENASVVVLKAIQTVGKVQPDELVAENEPPVKGLISNQKKVPDNGNAYKLHLIPVKRKRQEEEKAGNPVPPVEKPAANEVKEENSDSAHEHIYKEEYPVVTEELLEELRDLEEWFNKPLIIEAEAAYDGEEPGNEYDEYDEDEETEELDEILDYLKCLDDEDSGESAESGEELQQPAEPLTGEERGDERLPGAVAPVSAPDAVSESAGTEESVEPELQPQAPINEDVNENEKQEDDKVMKSEYFDQMFEKQFDRSSVTNEEIQSFTDESVTDQNKLVFLVEDEIPAEPESIAPEPAEPEPEDSILKESGEFTDVYKYPAGEDAASEEEQVLIEAPVVAAESNIRDEVEAESGNEIPPVSVEKRIKDAGSSHKDDEDELSDGRFDYII
jgi:hypothetical protein